MRPTSYLLSVTLLLCSIAHAAQPSSVAFDIDPQSMPEALNKFAHQSGYQLLFQSEVARQFTAPRVIGTLAPEEALKLLLANTGLSYRFINEHTITIRSLEAGAADSGTSGDKTEKDEVASIRITQAKPPSEENDWKSSSPELASQQNVNEESTRRIQEIIVTAQKRSEHLQDVPVPVTAISADALASSSQLRLQDYYTKIPGLGLAITGNGSEPVITLRGITTGAGLSPTVGIVVDEISYGSSAVAGGYNATVADIDPGELSRVEVLRGPQGTLYGASSMGGLLKFVTIDPATDRISGRVQVGGTGVSRGDELGYSVRGSFNVPLTDTFAVRASAFTTSEPGYIDNAETGERDVNHRENEGGRLAALWRPTAGFSLKVSALIQDSRRSGTDDVDVALGRDPQQSFLRGTGLYSRKTEAYSATMMGKLGNVELTAVTGYSVDDLFDNLDTTTLANGYFIPYANALGVDRAATLVHQTVEKFSQEIRVSVPIGQRINWLVGAFYTDEDLLPINRTEAVNPITGASAGLMYQNSNPMTFEEHALFTNLSFDITDRLDVQFGGRISENKQVFSTIYTGPVADDFFGSDPFTKPDLKSQDSPFTYLLTSRFKVSPDLMMYARVASGYRPGGPNTSCGIPQVPCEFDPDTTTNYEFGIKGNVLDRALSFDASLYYIDWKDIQISGVLTDVGFGYTGNGSRAKSQGVELSVESKPLTALTISAWAAYNEAELTEALPRGSLLGRSGDRLPYSSRFSGHVSVDQEFPLWGITTGFVGGSVSYVGDRNGRFQVTAVRETFPAYTQLDLRTGLRHDTWMLNVFVNNVTDKRGILRGGLDAGFIPSYFNYVQPRTFGLSLSKLF